MSVGIYGGVLFIKNKVCLIGKIDDVRSFVFWMCFFIFEIWKIGNVLFILVIVFNSVVMKMFYWFFLFFICILVNFEFVKEIIEMVLVVGVMVFSLCWYFL